MKYIIALLLLFVVPARADTLDLQLKEISKIETGDNPQAIGIDGERSAYQMTFAVWRTYTSAWFSQASHDPFLAREVARAHLVYLRGKLIEHGISPTIFNLGVAWHSGLKVAYGGRSNAEQTSYGIRLQNLLASEDLRRTTRRN